MAAAAGGGGGGGGGASMYHAAPSVAMSSGGGGGSGSGSSRPSNAMDVDTSHGSSSGSSGSGSGGAAAPGPRKKPPNVMVDTKDPMPVTTPSNPMISHPQTSAAAAATKPSQPQDPNVRFKIVRTLRDTLYGKVKLAVDTTTGRTVAVKLSSKERINRGLMKENPQEEMRLYRILNHGAGHPYILELIDELEDSKYMWTVLEFADRGEFFEIVVNAGRLEEAVAKKFFRQLALGTAYMHSRNICHLDLSLENLLLDAREDLKICDFGLAREIKNNQKFAAEVKNKPGKLGYMSPELFGGQAFDGRACDVYSSGVILFIILTGVPPFEMSAESDARFRLIYSGQLRKLLQTWQLLHVVSEQAIDLLSHMLCAPEKRYTIEQILAHPWLTDSKLPALQNGLLAYSLSPNATLSSAGSGSAAAGSGGSLTIGHGGASASASGAHH